MTSSPNLFTKSEISLRSKLRRLRQTILARKAPVIGRIGTLFRIMMLSVGCQDRNSCMPMTHLSSCSARSFAEKHRSFPFRPSIPTEILENYQLVMETPMFVQKVYKLVESDNDVIGWGPDGDKFIVYDSNRLQKELLPLYFNHSNFSSFIRQLHFYRFSKTTSSATRVEFRHPCFIRGRPNMLPLIVRKTNETGSAQKRHIMELEERIQVLEQENAQLRATISRVSVNQSVAVQDKVEASGFVCYRPRPQAVNRPMPRLSCQLTAIPDEISSNIPFNGQKRFRPTIVQSN